MAEIEVGQEAPALRLNGAEGEIFDLAQRGNPVVLFFYPKDNTEGCTLEAVDFSRLMPEFARLGVEVVGVSPDNAKSHDRFRAKHGLTVELLSDESKQTLDAFGVWAEKSMYGRKYMGVERTTILIGADGRIVQIWHKVKVPGHAEEVLAAAKALMSG